VKVGLCTNYIDGEFTGVGLYVRRLLERWLGDPEAPDLHLIHMQEGGDPLYGRAAAEHVYRASTRTLWWRSQDRACKRLSREMDLLHEPFMGLTSEMDCPQVLTLHDIVPMTNPEFSSRMFGLYFKRVMPRVIRNADAVVCNSETTRRDLLENYTVDPESAHVVYNGVDHVEAVDTGAFRDMEPYMVALSHTKMKNVGFTLREFTRYKDEHPGDLRLVVVGTDFSGLSEGRSDVTVTGYLERERLVELVAGAEALLFPSHYEGFGFPPLEAMDLGTPTVVSDRGSLPEVCGDASLTVDIDREGSMTEAIHRLRTEEGLADELRRRGLERCQEFSWERCARETMEVYQQVLG
jgi:glycosyltransferase involved in cell wall biosynthesis